MGGFYGKTHVARSLREKKLRRYTVHKPSTEGFLIQAPTMFEFDDRMVVVECRVDELPSHLQLRAMATLAKRAHEVKFAGTIGVHATAVSALISMMD